MKTVDVWMEQKRLALEDVAERARLTVQRVEAIAVGRWTPSPQERVKIASALEVAVEDVIWGHTMDPRNLRYRQKGFNK